MRNKMCGILMIICMNMIFCSEPVFAFSQYTYSCNADVQKDIYETKKVKIGYQYKDFGGVLYRRLYDFTNDKPLGDWELA